MIPTLLHLVVWKVWRWNMRHLCTHLSLSQNQPWCLLGAVWEKFWSWSGIVLYLSKWRVALRVVSAFCWSQAVDPAICAVTGYCKSVMETTCYAAPTRLLLLIDIHTAFWVNRGERDSRFRQHIVQLMNDQNALFAETHLSVFFRLSLPWLKH